LLPASGDAPAGCLHDALCETRDVVAWAAASKAIVARRQLRVGEAVIRETAFAPAPEAVVDAMLQGVRAIGVKNALGWSEKTEQWRRRVMWSRDSGDDALPDLSDAALEASLEEWLAPMLPGVTSISALRKLDGDGLLRCMVDYESSRRVEASCPTHVVVPSGSKLPVDYGAPGGTPVLRARLQELFGMTETPRAGANKTVAMEVHLLSPAGRPVQVTTDLKSFWANAYHDVAKEMRGRYPKHYWPEDPTTAEATNRAKPRKTK
jgi:ATP-dependent helicase HrpB